MTLPLSGLKILDFTTLLPGPYATQILADMGADVLRIEAPKRIDLTRFMPPMLEDAPDRSAAHASINRNKRAIAIDLKQPQAKEIIARLLADYDIVIEQFRPGVMARLGLDYESLKAIKPNLIYCSITGYGQTGAFKDRAGHDINYLALSGLASYSGKQKTGPTLSGTQIADVAGGSHHAVMGILAAVIQRSTNGEGQHIDISMTDASLALTTMFGAAALVSGEDPGLGTEILNGGIFYDYYQTSDERYFSVGSLEPQFAQAFFAALGHEEWLARTMEQDETQQQLLKRDIQTVFASRSFAEWTDVFASLDCCVEPVLTLSETQSLPHFQERALFAQVPISEGNDVKKVTQVASPIKFSNSEPVYRHIGAGLGEHTQEVLLNYDYCEEEIAAMREGESIL
jgi:crotonobetainyl-CoA:carnitine CoA-transferase CaiB-like acyl-CoA transferase